MLANQHAGPMPYNGYYRKQTAEVGSIITGSQPRHAWR